MRAHWGLFALWMAVALCVHGQPSTQPATQPLLPSVKVAFGQFVAKYGPWSFSSANGTIASFTGVSAKLAAEPDLGATTLLHAAADLSLANRELFSDPVIRSFDGVRQIVFQQVYKKSATSPSEPIENAYVAITVANNVVYDVTAHTVPLGIVVPAVVRKAISAEAIAKAAFLQDLAGEVDPFGRRLLEAFPDEAPNPAATTADGTVLLAIGGKLHRVYQVLVQARSGGSLVASINYAIDAASETNVIEEAVVRRVWVTHRAAGFARVFNPNPINTLNVCDLSPASIPLKAFFEVKLNELAPPDGGRFRLTGPTVDICDIEGPETKPPTVAAASEPKFFYCPNSAEFAAAMAYSHLEALQNRLVTLGFDPLVRRIDVDVDGAQPSDLLHAHYHDWPYGDGYLCFGELSSRFEAEDAELIAHELGHVILSRDTAGRFGSSDEARAIGEGFGDYWAISTFYDITKKNGHRVDCFAEWIGSGQCVRTTTAMASIADFVVGKPSHYNAQVWSALLYDIFRALGDRTIADRVILQGHLNRAFSGPSPTMREMAEGIVRADQQYYNGRHAKRLCAVLTAYGIEDLTCCSEKGCMKPAPGMIALAPQPVVMKQKDHCRMPAE